MLCQHISARGEQDYTLLRDGHEEDSVFDLEAQRKSSASIRRLLGLAKDETGVRADLPYKVLQICYGVVNVFTVTKDIL